MSNIKCFVLFSLMSFGISAASEPGGALYVHSGKDVVMTYNVSKEILAVRWGIVSVLDSAKLQQRLFYVDAISGTIDKYVNISLYKGRVSFVGSLQQGHAWFKITNVINNFTNNYNAFIREKGSDDYKKQTAVELIITETPVFTSEPVLVTTVVEHSNLNVTCSAVGPPKPKITWMNISSSNSITVSDGLGMAVLIIPRITRHYSGQRYSCEASNNPNEKPTPNRTTLLQVNYAPEIGKKFEQQSYCIGDKVRLDCVAVGNPEPNVTWSGPSGQKVNPSADLKMKKDKEFGNYTCVARNLVGSASYVLRLVKKNVSCQPPVTKPTPSPTDDVHPGIIAGVVIAAILAIAGLIVAIIFWKRRNLYTEDSENRNERSVRMNAIGDDDNVYATTQQPNREAPDRAQPTVQYAAVDKSKKTKKKRPGEGELIYADLDHETPAGERPPSDRRSTGGSGDQPTLYADIGSTRQETPRYGNLQDMDSM